jgi:5-hydroxyisourate hydrolase-like protein (transthyretin family)
VLRTLHVRRSLILIVLCLLTLGTLPGQMRRGMLTGTVTDARGRPLKGVSVQLENVATLQVHSSITNKAGRYRFYGLRSNTL